MKRVVHAEWTKFRTVPGWLIGLAVGAALMVALGLFPGMRGTCGSDCVLPVGPDGVEVTDAFTFVHRPMTGDGTITARVASFTGTLPPADDGLSGPAGPVTSGGPGLAAGRPGLVPWAKAGLIIKDGTKAGSTYAAVLLTGGHGVRMQHDYLHDQASTRAPASSPRWLRLTRTGETITGEDSADGISWTSAATVRLPGLPATAQVGLFVTSPQYVEAIGASGASSAPTRATATFDHVTGVDAAGWTTDVLGGPDGPDAAGAAATAAGYTVTGSGDIAPAVPGAAGLGTSVTQTLLGTFVALIFVAVVGTLSATGEYRRGLIRTTLAASPGRIRVLAAKAAVVGGVTFVTGLGAAAVVVPFGQRVLLDSGVYVHPATTGTEVRLILGTAALLAGGAVLALALGTVLRRAAAAVATAVVVIVLPYLLAMTVLPVGAGQWLLRVSPAAAFAVQQSAPAYPQVANVYTPAGGYFPLPPWGGLAVLGGWAVLALGLAAALLRRRDA